MRAQLSLKAALPLAESITIASHRYNYARPMPQSVEQAHHQFKIGGLKASHAQCVMIMSRAHGAHPRSDDGFMAWGGDTVMSNEGTIDPQDRRPPLVNTGDEHPSPPPSASGNVITANTNTKSLMRFFPGKQLCRMDSACTMDIFDRTMKTKPTLLSPAQVAKTTTCEATNYDIDVG